MKVTTKQARWGYSLLIAAVIIFIGYWLYLLEPLQSKLLGADQKPSFLSTVVRSAVFASLFSFLTFVGGSLTGFAWQRWSDSTDLNIGKALQSKAFLGWLIIWNGSFLLFSLLWKYGNF